MGRVKMDDELALYDATRVELRNRLSGRFPANFEMENTITAYAYWVCSVVRNHGKDWEIAVQEYVDLALHDAFQESQAEKIEVDVLRRELRQCASLLLDVGAGWGRFGSLYEALRLQAVYVEPSRLGCQLLQRNGLTCSAQCPGQSLAFSSQTFNSVVIGWVLHHDAPDVPAAAILSEISRVTAPSGRLLSIEPLSDEFDAQKWKGMIEHAGFQVENLEVFFVLPSSEKKSEQYACLAATHRREY